MTAEMMHTGHEEAAEQLDAIEGAFRDLSPTDKPIREAVIRQNERMNFDPSHAASILEVRSGSGEIGSKAGSYGELLTVDEEEIGDIIEAHVQGALDG